MSEADRLLALALRLPPEERRFLARALAASVMEATPPGDEHVEAWVDRLEQQVSAVVDGQGALDRYEPEGPDGA